MAYIDVGKFVNFIRNSNMEKQDKNTVLVAMQLQPTADVVEVKYGYWEIVKGSNGKEKMVCTNCRHQQDLHSTFTYCPNCGALIDGREIHNG
jgi:hypothetical protein